MPSSATSGSTLKHKYLPLCHLDIDANVSLLDCNLFEVIEKASQNEAFVQQMNDVENSYRSLNSVVVQIR